MREQRPNRGILGDAAYHIRQRSRSPRGAVTLTLKNIALNALYYAITVAALPALALRLEHRCSSPAPPPAVLQLAAAIAALLSVAVQSWCIVLLQRRGGGSPSPVAPPTTLVTEGPYRWLRNPLNLAEVLLLLAIAAWFGSLLLVAYALLAWLAFHLFIVGWEEPRHRKLYGRGYAAYEARVRRWLPWLPRADAQDRVSGP